jgi:hypothetical protein
MKMKLLRDFAQVMCAVAARRVACMCAEEIKGCQISCAKTAQRRRQGCQENYHQDFRRPFYEGTRAKKNITCPSHIVICDLGTLSGVI